MAQHDQVIDNAAGSAVRADINAALAALFSNSSGLTGPSTAVAHQFWADTTDGILKIRNAANNAWLDVMPLTAPTALGYDLLSAPDAASARSALGVGVAGADGTWTDVASATTTDLGAVASANVRITGTNAITSFGTVASGTRRQLRFAAALTLTHNATSLILPGGVSVTTAADDRAVAVSLGSGNWIVTDYIRADGRPLAIHVLGVSVATTSGSSISFTSIPENVREISILFAGVSTNGTAGISLQIGAGSTLSTGYLGTTRVNRNGASPAVANTPTDSWVVNYGSNSASAAISGTIVLRRHAGNTNAWVCDGSLGDTVTAQDFRVDGHNAGLGGALDRIIISTSDTFYAGLINIRFS